MAFAIRRGDAAQILTLDVGRQAHQAAHVVAVDLARRRAVPHLGHVAEQPRRRPVRLDRNDLHVGGESIGACGIST